MSACPKCGGTGSISAYAYVAGGICFQCNGSGKVASNGKAMKSVKVGDIKHTLAGTSKAETKLLIDTVLQNATWIEMGTLADKMLNLVRHGYMVERTATYNYQGRIVVETVYEPAIYFTRNSITILIK